MSYSLTTVAMPAVIALGSIGSYFKARDNVPEGSIGLRFRFGRLVTRKVVMPDGSIVREPAFVNPGLAYKIPFIERIRSQHVLDSTLQTKVLQVRFGNGQVYDLQIGVTTRVRREKGVYFAIVECEGEHASNQYEQRLLIETEAVTTQVGSTLCTPPPVKQLCRAIRKELRRTFTPYGVDVPKVMVLSFAPTWVTQYAEQISGLSDLVPLARQGEATVTVIPRQRLADTDRAEA